MLYDAPPAVGPDDPAAGHGDPEDVLDVEVLEAPAVEGQGRHPAVGHAHAPLHAQLLQVRTVLGQDR